MSELSAPAGSVNATGSPSSADDTDPALGLALARVPKASINKRIFASLIDNVILNVVATILYQLIAAAIPHWGDTLVYLGWLVLYQGYFLWFNSTSGQTIGKLIFKIKVVSADGAPLNWRTGLLRTGAGLFSTVSLIGLLWAEWDKKRQTWHDKIAGTYVVPASVTAEQLRARAEYETAQGARQRTRGCLNIGVAAAYLISMGLAILVIMFPLFGPTLSNLVPGLSSLTSLSDPLGLYDEDYNALAEAIAERVNRDDAIPSATVVFEYSYTPGQEEAADIWLVIDVSYTGTCDSTPSDPCEALIDELAGLALDNYARLDDMTGMRVEIVNEKSAGSVEWSDVLGSKSLSIEEWRTELDKD